MGQVDRRWLFVLAAVAIGLVAVLTGAFGQHRFSVAPPVHRRTVHSRSGPVRQPAIIWSVHTRQKVVALTFDDGPDPHYDYKILAILRRYGAHATFFLEGRNAIHYPEVVKAEMAGGNEIGNHTMNHRDQEFIPYDRARFEIEQSGRAIESVCGVRPRYVRPPRGHLSPAMLRIAAELDYQVVMWSAGLKRVKGWTFEQDTHLVTDNLRPGLVILAHDSSRTRWWVPIALPPMLQKIRARGYRVVTLGELLRVTDK